MISYILYRSNEMTHSNNVPKDLKIYINILNMFTEGVNDVKYVRK